MMPILLVFLGGGAGSVARYLMTNAVSRALPGSNFPWYTLSVNMLGAFVIGLLLEIMALRTELPIASQFLIVTGFIGGFTTFSAFSLDAALMLERGDYVNLFGYISLSVVGTIAAVFIGSGIVRHFS